MKKVVLVLGLCILPLFLTAGDRIRLTTKTDSDNIGDSTRGVTAVNTSNGKVTFVTSPIATGGATGSFKSVPYSLGDYGAVQVGVTLKKTRVYGGTTLYEKDSGFALDTIRMRCITAMQHSGYDGYGGFALDTIDSALISDTGGQFFWLGQCDGFAGTDSLLGSDIWLDFTVFDSNGDTTGIGDSSVGGDVGVEHHYYFEIEARKVR